MSKAKLIDFYKQHNYSDERIDNALSIVTKLEAFLGDNGNTIEDAPLSEVKNFVKVLIDQELNSIDNLRALSHYFYLTNQQNVYIYFTSLFGSRGVMQNIQRRIKKQEGDPVVENIFADIDFPVLGTPLAEMPNFTQQVMDRITDNLPPEKYRPLMAGNNHNVPRESMLKEKSFYESAASLDVYLKERHDRKVAELQEHCDKNQVWYEQRIDQDVVDFVKANQEILSAVRNGEYLYITKIPYDIIKYLIATNHDERKYYACHCPFVREALLTGSNKVCADWCYCSAGFAKYSFEVIFDTELEVELLNSPLMDDEICRFRIKLPREWNK